jgi:hypothetical protein
VAIVFRDRELSDLIGFVYSQWDAKAAVADFMKRLERIHQETRGMDQALASIILDGENAWESYPDDGHEFLHQLYAALAADSRFRCVTVSEFLQAHPPQPDPAMGELFSGSWIDANFATWIGHPEKNAAWNHLAEARNALQQVDRNSPEGRRAWQSFGAAEGSDWMWWFGDTHFSVQAEEFDRIFRAHVTNAYQLAGLTPPASLQAPIKPRAPQPLHSPTGMIHPTIDGRESSYYEWLYAGSIDLRQQYGALQRSQQRLRRLHFGFDEQFHYLRLDIEQEGWAGLTEWQLELSFAPSFTLRIRKTGAGLTASSEGGAQAAGGPAPHWAFDRVLEVAIPLALLPLAGGKLPLALTLSSKGDALERHPGEGAFELHSSAVELEAQAWPI